MNIYITRIDTDGTELRLDFTEDEKKHTLHDKTLSDCKAKENDDKEVIIRENKEPGLLVDEVREKFCGDVEFEYEKEGDEWKQKAKDLKNCPQHVIGASDKVIVKEEIIEDIKLEKEGKK
jgi:hypothetical protein